MNIANLNAHALMNTTESLIEMLRNNKKATISKIVTEWNICVEQSGYTTTFDFPVEGWTRKAQVIADLERCAAQLEELAFATETLTVSAYNNEVQTTDVLTTPEEENTMTNQKVNTVANAVVRAILDNRSDIEEVTTEQVQALQNMISAQAHFLTLNSDYVGGLYFTDESLAKAASYFYQFLANGTDVQGWIDSQVQSLAEAA
ncbi:TPA: hypothetical protein MAN53_004034 [Klebsiella pneumoniae]|uniref:hypothetical protein n=1 Tax=Klebsiella pneumoniae TaxID=573 RepID=UPI0009BC1ADB|nr:hypothetical protein [Klebsiella pneumoniae]SLO54004.1 Uncharacterised protein [Klebsiella pneumoniae]HBS6726845.1 hypothetical protein [Klebsiella pneumoniae]